MVQVGTGNITGGSQYLSTPNYISVNGDCTYSLSNFENKQFDAVVFYDSNKSYISATPLNRVEPLISHFTTPKNCKYIRWRYCFDNAASIDMLSEIQLELGDTATEYEPPITGRELTVNACGKNLIGISQAKALTGDNTNGFYIFDNIASRVIVQKLQPNTTYHLKKYDSGNRFRIVMFNNEPTNAADTTAIQLIYNNDGSMSDYTLTTGENHLWMVLATHYATSGDAIEPIAQLEYGDTATAYEPYHGSTTTITPDSNPYVIPNDIRQQDGLNNISVSAGTLSVTGVRKNAALKRVWKEMNDFNVKIGSINTILESVTGGAE